jgi:Lar family restriction alleviation protein
MADKLKPCPFCAGRALGYKPNMDRAAYVRCIRCDSHSPFRLTLRGAIAAWNRRAGGRGRDDQDLGRG